MNSFFKTRLNFSQASSTLIGAAAGMLAFVSFSLLDFTTQFISREEPLAIVLFVVAFSTFIWSLAAGFFINKDWIKTKNYKLHGIRGVVSIVSTFAGFFAFQRLSLSATYCLIFTAPLFNVLWSKVLLKETPTRYQVLGVCFGFLGILVALRPGFDVIQIGHLAALTCGICVSINALMTRQYGQKEQPLSFGLYSSAIMAAAFFFPAVINYNFADVAFKNYFIMLLLGLQTLINVTLLSFAIQRVNLILIGSLQYSQLIWGFLLEVIFLSVVPSIWFMLGSLFIIFGGLIVINKRVLFFVIELFSLNWLVKPNKNRPKSKIEH